MSLLPDSASGTEPVGALEVVIGHGDLAQVFAALEPVALLAD
jgi:hypothetical protein